MTEPRPAPLFAFLIMALAAWVCLPAPALAQPTTAPALDPTPSVQSTPQSDPAPDPNPDQPEIDRLFRATLDAARSARDAMRSEGPGRATPAMRATHLEQVIQLSAGFLERAPADPRAPDVWDLRLYAIYQTAVIGGSGLTPLFEEATRAASLDHSPQTNAVAHYFLLHCKIAEMRNASLPPEQLSAAELLAVQDYLTRHEAHSTYTAQLLHRAANLAESLRDRRLAIELYNRLASQHPDHPYAKPAASRANQLRLVGQVLNLALVTPAGEALDFNRFRGKWLFVAFLHQRAPDGAGTAAALARLLEQSRDVAVLVISLDNNNAELATWQTVWAGGKPANWPVHFDGLAFESPVARAFSVTRAPAVLLLNPDGRLMSFEALVDGPQIIFGARATTSQPARMPPLPSGF